MTYEAYLQQHVLVASEHDADAARSHWDIVPDRARGYTW